MTKETKIKFIDTLQLAAVKFILVVLTFYSSLVTFIYGMLNGNPRNLSFSPRLL